MNMKFRFFKDIYKCAQLKNLDAQVINNGRFSYKIYLQYYNAKPHVAKIVKEE